MLRQRASIARKAVKSIRQQSQKSRSFLISSRMLWPAPHKTACSASPSAPFNGFLPKRPSIFMCPMVHVLERVGTRDKNHIVAQWLAYTYLRVGAILAAALCQTTWYRAGRLPLALRRRFCLKSGHRDFVRLVCAEEFDDHVSQPLIGWFAMHFRVPEHVDWCIGQLHGMGAQRQVERLDQFLRQSFRDRRYQSSSLVAIQLRAACEAGRTASSAWGWIIRFEVISVNGASVINSITDMNVGVLGFRAGAVSPGLRQGLASCLVSEHFS